MAARGGRPRITKPEHADLALISEFAGGLAIWDAKGDRRTELGMPIDIDAASCHNAFTNGEIGNLVNSPGRHRRADTAATSEPRLNIPELVRLAEARKALEGATQLPIRWRTRRRRLAAIESADRALQLAAVAAHDAGIGWTQIGDALGIRRAQPRAPDTRIRNGELRLIRTERYEADVETRAARRAN